MLLKIKRPKQFKKPQSTERVLQVQAERYLAIKGILFTRVPDSLWGLVNTRGSVLLRSLCSKFLAGAPDLMIFGIDREGEAKTLLIELKDEKGKLLPSQIKWHSKTKVHVIRDFEGFRELVDRWVEK